jgi:hypothetical protein
MASCKHGNEHLHYAKHGTFLKKPSDYNFLKNKSPQWSQRDTVTDTVLHTPTASSEARCRTCFKTWRQGDGVTKCVTLYKQIFTSRNLLEIQWHLRTDGSPYHNTRTFSYSPTVKPRKYQKDPHCTRQWVSSTHLHFYFPKPRDVKLLSLSLPQKWSFSEQLPKRVSPYHCHLSNESCLSSFDDPNTTSGAGTASSYELVAPEFVSRQEQDISTLECSELLWGPPSPQFNRYWALSRG